MDNAPDSILKNLKNWILNDGICATASFISTSGKISMDESKSILKKFYNENRDAVDCTFLIFKKKIKKTADGTNYVHYDAILKNEVELNESIKDSSLELEETLGQTLYAVQPKGVLFNKEFVKRDFHGLISNFNNDDENLDYMFSDEDDDMAQDNSIKNNVDNDFEKNVIEISDESNDSNKDKGKKRKLIDDEKDNVHEDKESPKKRKVTEEIKKEENSKPVKTVKKKSSNTNKKDNILKENKSAVDLSKKEVITENFVDDDGFLVTKSSVKAVCSQPKEKSSSKPSVLKTKSEPTKVSQKQTFISNFFTKK